MDIAWRSVDEVAPPIVYWRSVSSARFAAQWFLETIGPQEVVDLAETGQLRYIPPGACPRRAKDIVAGAKVLRTGPNGTHD